MTSRRDRFDRQLVDGLTEGERIARLEQALFGRGQAKGLEEEHDRTRQRVQDIEHRERRRQMWWWERWFLGKDAEN